MRVGRVPDGQMRSGVNMRSSAYAVYRLQDEADQSTDSWGEAASENYTKLSKSRELFLYAPSSRSKEVGSGEEVSGTLQGKARPSVDIQTTDRVDHGGVRYEVTARDPMPDANNPDVIQLTLERV